MQESKSYHLAASSDEGIASSSMSHGRSATVSTVGTSTIATSTLRSGPEVAAGDPAAIAVHAQDADRVGFHYIEAEGETKHSDDGDGGGCCTHQPSTRWYCVSRGRAVGVFAGW